MMSADYQLRCRDCGQQAGPVDWRCPACAGPLRIEWMDARPAAALDPSRVGVWRYRPLLPLAVGAAPVTLGEGATPIVWIERWAEAHRLGRVGVKLETLNPTGSFKDRGTAVVASHAAALGATRLIEDSSGNAGASVAAYAARAGLPATVFAPAKAPPAKLAQISRLGAAVIPIEGSRAAVTDAALVEVAASDGYYVGHNANPYFTAGMATFAYELIEEFGAALPDHLVMPVGGGSLAVGCFEGFQRWFANAAGTRPRLPRIHGVQSDGCAPLAAAFERGFDRVDRVLPISRRPTIAGGIEVERPPRDREILAALRATEGSALAVDDAAILQERRLLAELEGIDVEPTSAAAFAGLAKLALSGTISRDGVVIVAATGAGWKDPSTS